MRRVRTRDFTVGRLNQPIRLLCIFRPYGYPEWKGFLKLGKAGWVESVNKEINVKDVFYHKIFQFVTDCIIFQSCS